jgi:hypothetical protein
VSGTASQVAEILRLGQVSGHDFSRAVHSALKMWALAPEGWSFASLPHPFAVLQAKGWEIANIHSSWNNGATSQAAENSFRREPGGVNPRVKPTKSTWPSGPAGFFFELFARPCRDQRPLPSRVAENIPHPAHHGCQGILPPKGNFHAALCPVRPSATPPASRSQTRKKLFEMDTRRCTKPLWKTVGGAESATYLFTKTSTNFPVY